MKYGRSLALFFLCSLLAIVLSFVILSHLFPLPPSKPYSMVIYDRHGKLLTAYLAIDNIWRLRTSPNEIPEKLRRILIKKEDKYFYYHPGVNPFSVARALARNIIRGKRVSGASTITMQVARMLEPKERTYFNKLVEIFRAFQLECKYSKNEILEMYLSMVPLGGNVEGLKSASLLYYQTPLERLNIAQLFDLILIPNDPNDLRPDRNAARLYEERLHRARPFILTGIFTRQDSAIIAQTSAQANRRTLPIAAPHYCLRLKEKFPKEHEIHGSLDLRVQRTVEALLSNNLREWKFHGVQNSAALVISNRTEEIIAYVGSENFDDVSARGQVDAVKALRSPGSTLKPFLVAMQMDNGVLTPKTRLLDVPYDAEGFTAENYDGKYSGLVYLDEALRRSLNVPMVRLLRETGVQPFLAFISNAGFNALQQQKEKLGLSVILGGCGVTLEELTAAYTSFPSSGNFIEPSFMKRSSTDTLRLKQVFSPSAAYMVTDILSGLDRPDLPNNFESSLNLPKVAFKTGTSYGRRDAWAIGYSSEYTVGVWVGNVTHRGNPNVTGGKAAAPLLIDIFNSISTGNQKSILPQPGDVLIREVCANSGLVPTERCIHVIDDYYSVRHTLNRFCDIDRGYTVSRDGKVQYCPSCLGGHEYKIVTLQEYPPELFNFWNAIGRSYHSAPPHNVQCTRVFAGQGPKIMSPSQDMTYFLVSSEQKICLQANSGLDVHEHIWYLDDRFLTREKANQKLLIPIDKGEHKITCMDEKGRTSSVKININYAL
ncbi:MAG: penicillin-binding protein 1C [Ignavibacteriae bacterium]|nr:penicillin-binding protein 1C [Ignavibacteria bacterium]MBI3365473.1 penicillin-binding protein 1C [Ignavibacteriota bacterium]